MSDPLTLLAELAAEVTALRARVDDLENNGARDAGSPWLSVREAAGYLCVSERKLQRLIARDRVRSTTLGRRRLLHRDDLDELARAATGEDVAPTTSPRHRRE